MKKTCIAAILVLTLSLRSQRAVLPPSRITIRKAVSAAPPARKVT